MPFRSIEDPATLRRLLEATLLIESNLQLPEVLRHVVEEARSMTGARYGALGVLNEQRSALDEFITVGLETEAERRIGLRPRGRGVLGLLITEPRPIRLARLGDHPESYGFPPHHPQMASFLGVPVKVRGEVYGNLYLTDKVGWSEFTQQDESLAEALALAAGIAVENARLHQRVGEVAVLEDRDRMARDLHDTVIQRLFAVGLSLQSMAAPAEAAGMADRLRSAVGDLDVTIRQVRSTIYELGSVDVERGVRAGVLSIIRELDSHLGFHLGVAFDGPVEAVVPDPVAEQLYAVVREAVTNVGRHAQASSARLVLSARDGVCRLEVTDDGQGIEGDHGEQGGLGLGNMAHRAEKLGGHLTLGRPDGGGTTLVWEVPLDVAPTASRGTPAPEGTAGPAGPEGTD